MKALAFSLLPSCIVGYWISLHYISSKRRTVRKYVDAMHVNAFMTEDKSSAPSAAFVWAVMTAKIQKLPVGLKFAFVMARLLPVCAVIVAILIVQVFEHS